MIYNDLWFQSNGEIIKGPLSEFNYPHWTIKMEEQIFCREHEYNLLEGYRKINKIEKSKKSGFLKNLLTVKWLLKSIQEPEVSPAIRGAGLESLGYLSGFHHSYVCTDNICCERGDTTLTFIKPPKKGDCEKIGGFLFCKNYKEKIMLVKSSNHCVLLEKDHVFQEDPPNHAFIQLDRDNNRLYTYLEEKHGMTYNDICSNIKHFPDRLKSLKFVDVSWLELADYLYSEFKKRLGKKWEENGGEWVIVESIIQEYQQ